MQKLNFQISSIKRYHWKCICKSSYSLYISPRGDGGVVFLVRECLVNEVEFINTVKYEESMWMKIRSERGREALYIGCVYMPTDSTSISVMDSCS